VCKGAVIAVEKKKKKMFRKEAKIGISFKSTTNTPGKIFVSAIKEESKFTGTDLTVGHQILAINGETCPARVADAVELLTKKGMDTITLVTIDPEDEIVVPKPKEEAADAVEEKNDDEEADAADAETKVEEESTSEGNKSLIDTMFGVCMC